MRWTMRCISRSLNPPRPHGRGHLDRAGNNGGKKLKSTPPTRAGTPCKTYSREDMQLKSTPPTRAGTHKAGFMTRAEALKSTPPTRAGTKNAQAMLKKVKLKSTPPTRAGTTCSSTRTLTVLCLNPPRPHGRGPDFGKVGQAVIELKSTPPTRAGTQGICMQAEDLPA